MSDQTPTASTNKRIFRVSHEGQLFDVYPADAVDAEVATLTARCEALEQEKRTLTERCEEQFRYIAIIESREKSEHRRCEALTAERDILKAELQAMYNQATR